MGTRMSNNIFNPKLARRVGVGTKVVGDVRTPRERAEAKERERREILNPEHARPMGVMEPEEWSEEAREAIRKRNGMADALDNSSGAARILNPLRRIAEDLKEDEMKSQQQTDMAVGDLGSTKKGSGARANRGKVALSLFPMHLLAGASRIFMGGAMKYAQWNWAKGMQHSTCVDCFLRHFNKWWYMGEDIDDESGEHHIDHMICNLIMLRHYIVAFKEGDDRPPQAITHFDEAWDFATGDFDEEAYLERNPAVRKKLDELQRTREQG
jgi:hypothetical protein